MVIKLPKRPRLPMVGMRIFSIMLDQVSTVFSGQEQLPARSGASNAGVFMETLEDTEARNDGRIFITTELKGLCRRDKRYSSNTSKILRISDRPMP